MSNSLIKLVEHKASSSDDVGPFDDEDYANNKIILQGLRLEDEEDKKLSQILKKEKILTIKELKTGLEISPTSYIGIIQFSNFSVKVFPKYSMTASRVHQLLDFVWDLKPKTKLLDSTLDVEEEEAALLTDIVIKSLIDQSELLLKQGLLKSYINHEENVSFLRGKLILKQQIQNTIKNNAKFACQFDELEFDNVENQILLAALIASHNITNDEVLKRNLRLMIHQFSILVSQRPISSHDFEMISYTRLNQHYEAAHDLSRLILESLGFKEYQREKKIKIIPFFINMDDVFEKFVEKLFKLYYSSSIRYRVTPQKSQKAWKSETDKDYRIRTDILVTDSKDRTRKFIVDTKYKEVLSPQDRYQIGFYIHEHKQKEGTAILPRFPDSKNDEVISEVQSIKINLKRIDISNILDLIYNERERELLEKIDEFIRTDMKLRLR